MKRREKEKDMYEMEGGITYDLHGLASHDTSV